MSVARLIVSGIAGIGLVVTGLRFSWLHWIVDGPGWIVTRFTSVDFHEGEGALGFLLALFLAWFWLSALVWVAIYAVRRVAGRAK